MHKSICSSVLNRLYSRLLHVHESKLDESSRLNESTSCITVGAKRHHPKHIFIGGGCMFSIGVQLYTDMYWHGCIVLLMNQQGHDEVDKAIGDDTQVGYNMQIMPVVAIGSHAIVNVDAAMTHNVSLYAVGHRDRGCPLSCPTCGR